MADSQIPARSKLIFIKSSWSAMTDCVEVARFDEGVAVRDSKAPAGPMLVFARDAWGDFVEDVKAGSFD